ncbi:MAG: YihY/virulence factor BrkB family protein, partial [Propionibacteriales bacterium]|nr:YihY/virulence factor BrkB family protein [Propionibacteriales bacterium]
MTASQQSRTSATSSSDVPGFDATSPREIPAGGWWQVTKRAWAEAKLDQVPLLAAGVAFFSFLSLFPAMIAAVLAWGLIADPTQIRDQAKNIATALPKSARDLLMQQIGSLIDAPQQSLGFGLLFSLALALWSASGGVGNLISAVNLTYDEEETRGFVRRKLLALGMTLAMIIGGLLALGLVAVAPAILDAIGLPGWTRFLLEIGRWLVLLALVAAGLALIYRIAPDRDAPQFKWVSTGALVATVIWLVASLAFSLYVDNFSSYGKTYGSLAAVVVLLLWLWISFYVVLLGAEINAESEAQTIKDSTTGQAESLG